LPKKLRTLLTRMGRLAVEYVSGMITKAAWFREERSILMELPSELVFVVNAARLAGYRDIHGENVMTDALGQYKMIDIESILRGRKTTDPWTKKAEAAARKGTVVVEASLKPERQEQEMVVASFLR
jgi:hypothetical protein